MSYRRLGRNAAFSVAQVVLSSLILLALYRTLSQYLTIAEIGLWSLIVASTSIARLSEFGLGGGVMRFVAADLGAGDSPSAARTIFMAAVLVAAMVGTGVSVALPLLAQTIHKAAPTATAGIALRLLPYALASLVLGTIANVFISALDGCQRSDLRAIIQLLGAASQLLGALLLLPHGGIVALGPVQIIQGTVTLMAAAIATIVVLRVPIRSWFGWERKRVRELVSYGGGIQVAAIGQLLFDPTVKLLLAVFGGLAFTGYYELANRLVLQARSVLVSAMNMVVPFVAGRLGGGDMDSSGVASVYRKLMALLLIVTLPYYTLLAVALPLFLTIWIGHYDARFIIVGLFCTFGWAGNTLVGPAYFLFLAVGKLRWTVWSQVTIGVLNVILAALGGWMAQGIGVVGGSAVALVVGSSVVVVAFHRQYSIRAMSLLTKKFTIVIVCSLGILTVLAIALASDTFGRSEIAMAALWLTSLLIMTVATLLQPPLWDAWELVGQRSVLESRRF